MSTQERLKPEEAPQIDFNGIDGETGEYLFPAMTPAAVARLALSATMDQATAAELRFWCETTRENGFGPMEGVDPLDLAEAGWGVVFAEGVEPAVREALRPLLDLRRRQAGERYRELVHHPGETKQDFLVRYGAGPGPTDPEKLPYYLLLVGSPREIPFAFQYRLDVQHAVGRLDLEAPEEYASYAAHAVAAAAEAEQGNGRPEATLFGVAHAGDSATQTSRRHLIAPLEEALGREASRWGVRRVEGESATRERLLGLLGGQETPSVLFTASHGMGFPCGHPSQRERQGALLCQDWGGQDFLPEHSVAAPDLPAEADPRGLIAFLFGCYTGGTPDRDEYRRGPDGEPRVSAPEPFVARLPQRLLAQGALAVVGHVDRAWTWSFVWRQAGPQISAYLSALRRLLGGQPVGWAMEPLNQRYAELATDLTAVLEEIRRRELGDPADLADLWTAHNDARSFVLLGDPAARAVPRRGE